MIVISVTVSVSIARILRFRSSNVMSALDSTKLSKALLSLVQALDPRMNPGGASLKPMHGALDPIILSQPWVSLDLKSNDWKRGTQWYLKVMRLDAGIGKLSC